MATAYVRRNTTQRGLGWNHRRTRARLLPAAYDKPCPMCGQPMLHGQALDLDHEIPRVLGGGGRLRIVHRYCNRAAGARLGNRRRTAAQETKVTSRSW